MTVPAFEDLPVMDLGVIVELESALSKELVSPMFSDFAESLAGHVKKVEVSVQTDTLENIKKQGHAIKGLCRQFGATRLGEVGAFMEYDSESLDDIKSCLPMLKSDSAEIIKIVSQHVNEAA